MYGIHGVWLPQNINNQRDIICSFPLIGPEDIYEGNPKLILGLVWTLIGRYQIRSSGRSLSTKAALKEWLFTLIPEYNIQNFSSDWNDGRPLCGLVDCLKPGLCPNHMSLNPNNGLENCKKGMMLAEEHLDIPMLLDPEDMNNPDVDDLSVMTYIAYFFTPAMSQLLEWIQKKIPENNITNLSTDWNNGINLAALEEACHTGLFPEWKNLDPRKAKENLEECIRLANDKLDITCPVSAAVLSDPKVDEIIVATYLSRFKYSKLLASPDEVIVTPPIFEHGCGIVNQPVEVEVELGSTPIATLSHLTFTVSDPNGKKLPVTIGDPKKTVSTVTFVPKISGNHPFSCTLNNADEVQGCPFEIPVVDPASWSLSSNLPNILQVNKPITLEVVGPSHGPTPKIACDAYIDTGEDSTDPTRANGAGNDDGSNDNSPEEDENKSTTDSIEDRNDQVEDPKDSIVTGLDKPAVVGEEFSFTLKPHKPGELDVLIQGPETSYTPEIENINDDDDNDDGGDGRNDGQQRYAVNFTPDEVGNHTVEIAIDGNDIKGSPFNLSVVKELPAAKKEETDDGQKDNGEQPQSADGLKEEDQPVADGEGDIGSQNENDKEKQSATSLEEATPIEKPREKAQFIQSSGSLVQPGKYNMYLLPTDTGKAKVHVTIGDVDVKNSPFKFMVVDSNKCFMTNLDKQIFLCEQKIEFDVTLNESPTEPTIAIQGPSHSYTPNITLEEEDQRKIYHCWFVPDEPGIVKISALLTGENIQGSPSTVQVSEPSIISELPKYMEVGKMYTFDVLVDNSLKEHPIVSSVNNDDNKGDEIIEASIYKNESLSNHWKLIVKPLAPGTTTISVKVWNFHVKKSPFSAKITAISQCRVEGIEEPLSLNEPFPFTLYVSEGLTQKPEVMLYTPSSQSILSGADNGDGSHSYAFTPVELGTVKVAIHFGGQDIPGSPFTKQVEFASEPKNCIAFGPALHPNTVLQVGRPIEFSVDTTKAGNGELQVVAKGPRKENVNALVAEENGIYSLRINADSYGKYRVHVWWSQVYIPKSPFTFRVHQVSDYSKVRVYGSGVSNEIEVGRPAEFFILTKDAGNGRLVVNVYGIKDAFKVDVKAEDPSEPRILKATYNPSGAGDYKVIVKWSDNHVPGSPFLVKVTDRNFEIEMARIEERRKEKLKRVESQQKILEKQNMMLKKKLESMPNFGKQVPLAMGKGGQFAGAIGGGHSTIEKKVHIQKQRRKLVRNASAGAIQSQTQSLTDLKNDKRSRKISAPNQLKLTAGPHNPRSSEKRSSEKKLKSTRSFDAAMQRNAEFLGVSAPIGGSLKGGVAPMWLKDFPNETGQRDESLPRDVERTRQLPLHQPPTTSQIYDMPELDEPVSIQPIYDLATAPEDDVLQPSASTSSEKKKKKRSNKKR